jgi:hypothetical protein
MMDIDVQLWWVSALFVVFLFCEEWVRDHA